MRLSHFQNESYVPQLFTRKFSPKEPKCVNGLAVRIGMASVFKKTAWKMGLYYDNAKKLLKMNEQFPAVLLKAWRNWPTLLGKHFCWFLNH